MATMFAGPFPPVGYDSGLYFESSLEDETLSLSLVEDWPTGMTQLYPSFYNEAHAFTASSPLSSRENAPKPSPAVHSHRAALGSGGSASLSPPGAGPIFTPTSTLLDYDEDAEPSLPDASLSPDSNTFSPEDFVHLDTQGEEIVAGTSTMANQLPCSPSVISSTQSSQTSQPPSAPQSTGALLNRQWQRSHTLPTHPDMDDHFMPYGTSADLGVATASWADEDSFSNTSTLDKSRTGDHYGNLPFRTLNYASMPGCPAISADINVPFPHTTDYVQGPDAGVYFQQNQPNHDIDAVTCNHHINASHQHGYIDPGHQTYQTPTSIQPDDAQAHIMDTTSTDAIDYRSKVRQTRTSAPPSTLESMASRRVCRTHTSYASHRPSQGEKPKRGGRERNSHLSDGARKKSSDMRKRGACWRCAMQRDPCDHGEPCQRCMNRDAKGQLQFFPCERSKLPDFIHELLPPSMTFVHQKQGIEDTVKREVLEWDMDHQLDLYLTFGYGPPLMWRCHEFRPKTNKLLTQLQYTTNWQTGQPVQHRKYSPPFGLHKLDMSDDYHFEAYLEQLMQPRWLTDLGWSFYEEEWLQDPNEFQAQILDLMCKLYLNTTDTALQGLLQDILRMILLTFIMSRTLTIAQETIPTVLDSVRHTPKPPQHHEYKHVSPRLANRQLKFFFGILRAQIYEKILKWQQQTFHTGGKKEATWMQSFCVLLGFAMVLEEVQSVIHLQADTNAARQEKTREEADTEAYNAFVRIDERYKLLVGLFQCKYRDKKWNDNNGSFGPHTPELSEPPQREFLSKVRFLLIQNQLHLKQRQSVPFGRDMQCMYATRLTARFLLPFLTLQGV